MVPAGPPESLNRFFHYDQNHKAMALQATTLPREFKFKKDGDTVTLPDPNPDFTVSEVLQFYSNQYPELTTATLEGPKTEGGAAVYSVKTTVGTKG